MSEPVPPISSSISEIALLFLKLGATAFGGPAAHIAMMEQEVVRRRNWLTHQEFLDLLAATNLIPGPNSTEMAIHIGHRRAGWPGLLVAGACFIFPAAVIVTGIAWAYVRFGKLPEAHGLLYGVKAVIIAVVVQALWLLARSAIKTVPLAIVALAAVALNLLGMHELLLLFSFGAALAVARLIAHSPKAGAACFVPFLASTALPSAAVGLAAGAAVPFTLAKLFLFFLKVGAVLYGSGYVLLAFLRADLVQRWGWLTEQQLLDAIAVGQITPGPVFTTATFIGYLLGSLPGAGLATLGIFLPAFFFVAISGPLIPRLRKSPVAAAFLDGVVVASLALMTVVTAQLARAALVDWITILLAALSAYLLFRYKLNSAWIVLIGASVGILVHFGA
jgi:chromate transporter